MPKEMNRRGYSEACSSTAEPIQRNFIRENVLRLKNMQRQKERTKNSEVSQQQPKNMQTKSLQRVAEKVSETIKPKQLIRRPTTQIKAMPVSVGAVIETCERGIQTEPSGELSQGSPDATDAMHRRAAGNGDVLSGCTSPAVPSVNKPGQSSSSAAPRQREGFNRPTMRSVRANQITNRKVAGNTDQAIPISSTNKGAISPKEARLGKIHPQKTEKEEMKTDCPRGHVMLPEEERERTLHLLMDSYKAKVSEMNSLPVRSDTLKLQRRKMALEEELKKIDEGIKIFQRAKVFVKANA